MTAREAARRAVLGGVRRGRRDQPQDLTAAAPAIPTDWRTAPPDFVGIGVSGTATAWWHELIERHPDVARAFGTRRDLHWFDRFWTVPFTPEDAARYAQWFPRPEGAMVGEWTSTYYADFWVPSCLAAAAPNARLLIMVRDPVERYAATRDRARAVAHRWDDRDALAAFQRGLYAEPLRRFVGVYPRDRILVLQEEACRRDPPRQLAATFAFLGLPPADVEFTPPPPQGGRVGLPADIAASLVAAYAPDLAELNELQLGLDLTLWPSALGGTGDPA